MIEPNYPAIAEQRVFNALRALQEMNKGIADAKREADASVTQFDRSSLSEEQKRLAAHAKAEITAALEAIRKFA